MKNPPYHIESVTCEDQVRCIVLSQVFRFGQNAIFLKSVEVGQLSVQAETLYSNKLASVTRRLVPGSNTSMLGILFRVMFTKHSPEFYLICANLALNDLYYCRLSQGILGLSNL